MVNKKTRNIALSVSAALCFGALAGALASLRPLRASAAGDPVYNQNFEGFETSASGQDIQDRSGWVEARERSIVQTPDTNNFYVDIPFAFTADGYQTQNIYLDTSRGVSTTEKGAEYTLEVTFRTYGELMSDMQLQVQSGDSGEYVQDGTKINHACVIYKSDTDVELLNYGTDKSFATDLSHNSVGGWEHLSFKMKGTGTWFMPLIYMNVAKGNADAASYKTGVQFAQLDVKKSGGEVVYTLDGKLQTGVVGKDNGIFQATGLAGFLDCASITCDGIEGKTLKAVHNFYADGGWQQGSVYLNSTMGACRFEADKQYILEFDIAPFGPVDYLYALFSQEYYDGTYHTVNSGGKLNIIGGGIDSNESDTFVDDGESTKITRTNGIFHVKATVNGYGGNLKLEFNLHSADSAHTDTVDTEGAIHAGFYIDNIVATPAESGEPVVPVEERTYKTVYSESFTNVSPDAYGQANAEGSVFTATGFAGAENIRMDSTDGVAAGNQCLKATIKFHDTEDHPWQAEELYLDVNKVSNTSSDHIYRYSMKVKPFGKWNYVYVGFQKDADGGDQDWIVLHTDGTSSIERSGKGSTIVKDATTYADGVFSVEVYLTGKDAKIFNLFRMNATERAAADTGFYLDDFKIEEEVTNGVQAGLNKTATIYNKTAGGDLSMSASLGEVRAVKIDGSDIATENYTYSAESNLFVVKEAALKGLEKGTRTLSVESSKGNYECKIEVIDIYESRVYSMSLASVSLSGSFESASKEFWNASGNNLSMDETTHWVVASDAEGLKFTPKAGQYASFLGLINTNGGMLTDWKAGIWNSLSVDVKATNAIFNFDFRAMKTDGEGTIGSMQVDVMGDRRVDSGEQSSNLCWSVEDIEGKVGWKHVTIRFRFTEDTGAKAYVRIQAAMVDVDEPAEIVMDNFAMFAEFFPTASETASQYDKATDALPTYNINVYDLGDDNHAYEISEVKCGETALQGTDYTVTYAGGTATLKLSKAFCQSKEGEEGAVTIEVTTSKGNKLTLTFTVIDTAPVLPTDTKTYDKAQGGPLNLDNVDMKGNPIAKITYGQNGEHTVDATRYNLTNNTLTLKAEFFAELAPATYTFTVESNSGAKATFTVTVVDTTPVLGTASEYEKQSGADFTVDLDTKEQSITKVEIGSKTLTASEYSYAEGKLTVKKAVFDALPAGTYTLKVTTATSSASVEVVVKDVPPVIADGTYTATQDGELVVTVDLKGRDIVSVSIGDEVLLASDYTYADGKLTVKSSILGELAAGKHTLTVTTAGGSDEVEFTLEEAAKAPNSNGGSGSTGSGNKDEEGEKKGCGSSIALAGGIAAASTLLAAAFVTKRKKH